MFGDLNFVNKSLNSILRLYAVTDRRWVGVQTLLEQIESAIIGGATAIQLREKDMEEELFIKEAISTKKICQRYKVPLIINDNLNVALACNADGIHLGQNDISPMEARKKFGNSKIIGVSVHTVEEALLAEKQGADYIGVGTVFSTKTKADVNVIPKDLIIQICRSVSLPAVAIGGISDENMDYLHDTGVVGFAVVSAIFAQPDIELATFILKNHCDKVLGIS